MVNDALFFINLFSISTGINVRLKRLKSSEYCKTQGKLPKLFHNKLQLFLARKLFFYINSKHTSTIHFLRLFVGGCLFW